MRIRRKKGRDERENKTRQNRPVHQRFTKCSKRHCGRPHAEQQARASKRRRTRESTSAALPSVVAYARSETDDWMDGFGSPQTVHRPPASTRVHTPHTTQTATIGVEARMIGRHGGLGLLLVLGCCAFMSHAFFLLPLAPSTATCRRRVAAGAVAVMAAEDGVSTSSSVGSSSNSNSKAASQPR